MKIYKLFILSLILLVCLCGCGDSSNPFSDNNEPQQQVSDTDSDIDEDILPWTYKVPGSEIYVSVPNLQEISFGFTQIYQIKKNSFYAVTCAVDDICNDLMDAHSICFDVFMANIQDTVFANSLSVVSDSVETINGIEFYKFEGVMNCGHSNQYDAYTIGYSFVMDSHPCSIIGMASHDDQSDALIQQVRDTINSMAQTVRDHQ